MKRNIVALIVISVVVIILSETFYRICFGWKGDEMAWWFGAGQFFLGGLTGMYFLHYLGHLLQTPDGTKSPAPTT
jgi:hypothetical protein